MKRIILVITFIIVLILPANADVMPYYVSNVSTEAIGVYQAPKDIYVYSKPNEKSPLLLEAHWDYRTFSCSNSSVSNLFLVMIAQKELAFLTVTDITDDWVEVIYNRSSGKKGWLKREDLRYLHWRSFYNIYGGKYGLYLLKDTPEDKRCLKSSTSEDSQTVDSFKNPQKIKLTVVKGNWAFVTILDIDKSHKMGYLQWRNTSGEIYAFPAIK